MKKHTRFSKALKNCDLGTQELISKRIINITKEPLDLCFEKGLINLEQHQYGVRFRWLYSLRFGAIGISSNFPSIFSHRSKQYDADWLAKKQKEYGFIMDYLKTKSTQKIVHDICIHCIYPHFLTKPFSLKGRKDYGDLLYALDLLENGFRRFSQKN